MANYKPAGFGTVTPYLMVDGAARLIKFLQEAFDAEVLGLVDRPDGSVMHAELRIGDSMLEMSDGRPEYPAQTVSLHMYVPDVDAAFTRAVAAGAQAVSEPTDKFYGDRDSAVKDPAGNNWYIATHKEDVSEEEVERRAQQTAPA